MYLTNILRIIFKKLMLPITLVFLTMITMSTQVYGKAYGSNSIIFQPGPGLNNGSDEGGLNGGKDSYSSRPDSGSNYGTQNITYATPRSTCNSADYISFIQFDISSLPSNVDKVYLGVTHIPHTSYCYSNCSADFYFYPVSTSWNEMSITNNNMPTIDTGHPAFGPLHITFPNDLGNQEYDITNIYNAWKNGTVPNKGLAIYSPTVGCNNAAVFFGVKSSDESNASQRPYLRIIQSAVPNSAVPVPILSDTGRIILILLMAFAALLWLRKKATIKHF